MIFTNCYHDISVFIFSIGLKCVYISDLFSVEIQHQCIWISTQNTEWSVESISSALSTETCHIVFTFDLNRFCKACLELNYFAASQEREKQRFICCFITNHAFCQWTPWIIISHFPWQCRNFDFLLLALHWFIIQNDFKREYQFDFLIF